MAEARFDILIAIRDQLAGLDKTNAGLATLRERIAESRRIFVTQAAAALGVTSALALLVREVRHVITNIDRIPGVPPETVRSIKETERSLAEARQQIDLWIAKSLTWVSKSAQGLGYMAAAIAQGRKAVIETLVAEEEAIAAQERAAQSAARWQKQLAEIAKEAAESIAIQRAAAKAARNEYDAMLAAQRAFREASVDESPGERADRLRREAAGIRALGDSASIADRDKLFRLATEALRIEKEIESERNALAQRRQAIEFRALDSSEQAKRIAERIAEIERDQARIRVTDLAAKEEANRLEREKLDLIEQKEALKQGDQDEGESAPFQYPDRNDVAAQMKAALESLPTAAESAGMAVQSVFSQVSDGIYALIEGTSTWRDALLDIAGSFRQSFLRAIADIASGWITSLATMAAEYALKKGAMFAVDVAFAAKSLALSIASAARSLLAWIPSAIAAGISSFGTAAVIGTAAVVGALAAFGGFAEGGYTGDGPRDRVAGTVHAGEYVFSAPAVRAMGVDQLGSLHATALAGRSVFAPPVIGPLVSRSAALSVAAGAAASVGQSSTPEVAPNAEPPRVAFGVFDRRSSAEDFLESARGQRFLYDFVRRTVIDMGGV